MAFLETRMDSRIERLAVARMLNRGRTKLYDAAGRLGQVFRWSAPLYEFDVQHGARDIDTGYETLRAQWHVINFVPYEGFRFRHWGDYVATMVNTHVVDLGGGSYQLCRRYTFGGINFDRIISKPNSDAVLRDSGGSPLTATISTTTGIATGVSGGTPAKWTGTFDVPVTFAENLFPELIEASGTGQFSISQPIMLEEIRL
jgi:uncharacterized protein (TIGR02217 family)